MSAEQEHTLGDCLCDWAGRECCPVHANAEDAQGWIDFMADQDREKDGDDVDD